MTHYAIFEREIYEVCPKYEEMVSAKFPQALELYSNDFGVESKYEDMIETDRYSGVREWYFVNCITHNSKNTDKIIHWEGKLFLNELKIGENITINNESFQVLNVNKNVNGKITYKIENKYIKCENYDDLYALCEIKYNENSKVIVTDIELNSKKDEIKEEKRTLWDKLFG
ncbi:hypothetical protein ABNX05_11185 [Lysinibacillus sp. M3]|uniref:Uncharacterized protein n=1 Tax=Lysinibacillus zambalensis TaxID=3160866 RepID=A0ABV1MRQ4_9BACI